MAVTVYSLHSAAVYKPPVQFQMIDLALHFKQGKKKDEKAMKKCKIATLNPSEGFVTCCQFIIYLDRRHPVFEAAL